jgi:outer membrane lipoprotein LolB
MSQQSARHGGALRAIALLGALGLMAGCVTTQPKTALPAQSWQQRLASLQSIRDFNLQGRIAVAHGADGFSAGLRWQQQQDQTAIDLSAPLGFGAAHIQQSNDLLRVTTSKGVVLERDAANDELRETLGFDAPLKSLRFWIVGATDPNFPAEPAFDASQRLLHLQQEGWQIDYAGYMPVNQQFWLPGSLTATREDVKVKIVIHEWQLHGPSGE